MKLKNVKRVLGGLSFAALIIAVLARNTIVSVILVFLCMAASIVILYPNLAKLSNISEDNPKVKSLKAVTIFNIIFVAVVILLVVLLEHFEEKELLSGMLGNLAEGQVNVLSKFVMALLLAVPMLVFGNVAPKIPFNRYTGLRLPWTVRDEDTWIVAHRVLGYISLPIAILVFANVPTDMPLNTYVKFWWLGAFILWIAIPGVISGIFYSQKWRGKV